MHPAQLALVTLRLVGSWIIEGEQLLLGETLHLHSQFLSCVDTTAQVPLKLGLGGKLFVTNLAFANCVVCVPVSSESGNLIYVEKT